MIYKEIHQIIGAIIVSILLNIVKIAIQRTLMQLMIINVITCKINNNKSNDEINLVILEVNIYKTLKRKIK